MSKKSIQSDLFVSVVAPFNEGYKSIYNFTEEVSRLLKENYENYELVLVDNGALNYSPEQINDILKKLPCIRIIRLSRQADLDTAIFAGFEASIGDFVISLVPESDKPEVIPKVVELLRSGSDIVYGRNKNALGNIRDIRRKLFYWYSRRFLKIDLDASVTHLLGLNRRALNALAQLGGRYRHLRQLSRLVGFIQQPFDYRSKALPNKRGLLDGIDFALEISITYSRHPLRFVSFLGLFAGVLDFIYALYSAIIFFSKKDVAPGWTSISLQISVMFFFVFMILVILSEYIGHILEETRQTPSYHIMEELNSNVMVANGKRRNVTS